MNPPRETFLDVATSVGDGAPLDWSVLGTSADLADDPALLCELEIIARIARAHRSVARDAMTPPDEGRRWSHLLIREELGAGSFATVYRAHDTHLQRDVALKIYNAAILPGDRLTRVFAEGRLLARVRHPNVVIVHGLEQLGDEVGLWLELIDGRTLADEVRDGGALGFRETALVGQDLCRALAAVHLAGLVHRDVEAAERHARARRSDRPDGFRPLARHGRHRRRARHRRHAASTWRRSCSRVAAPARPPTSMQSAFFSTFSSPAAIQSSAANREGLEQNHREAAAVCCAMRGRIFLTGSSKSSSAPAP